MNYRNTTQNTINTFLSGAGKSTRQLRRAVIALTSGQQADADQPNVPETLQPYLNKVAYTAYKITDEDVDQLKREGYSEDQIFELTIAAAIGASKTRLDIGLQLLEGAT